ncbi:hypothetical protein LCGC14_0270810 [marine sediment metagenome]|uniref:Uncharacterized protein n=1 Tax=marine sediment metagenome TaxID=412755 RepID=A0A0F9UFR2_9ZZZZ
MLAKTIAVAFTFGILIPAQVLAQCASDGGTGTGDDYATMVLGGEGGGVWNITNILQESTASGAFQFTYGTLQDLGYITHDSRSVNTDMYGPGEWEGDVNWTGLDGVNSRMEFLNNQAAQVSALSRFTANNLDIIGADYSSSANGVPITPGGVGYASHFLGAGGFQQWSSCGYQPSCLPAAALGANSSYTPETMNDMLMGRMAEGAGVDPNCINLDNYEGEIPPIVLMPWNMV